MLDSGWKFQCIQYMYLLPTPASDFLLPKTNITLIDNGYPSKNLTSRIYTAVIRQGAGGMEVGGAGIPGLVSLAERSKRGPVGRLKRLENHWYISLCREDICWLMVDTREIQVLHAISLNTGLVESGFHPNFIDR